jgi:hypothetical protein
LLLHFVRAALPATAFITSLIGAPAHAVEAVYNDAVLYVERSVTVRNIDPLGAGNARVLATVHNGSSHAVRHVYYHCTIFDHAGTGIDAATGQVANLASGEKASEMLLFIKAHPDADNIECSVDRVIEQQ